MNADNRQVVIVGAGHAGGSAAALLRQYGWPGSIVLLGDEPILPYQRPPPMPASPALTASSSMTTPALLTDPASASFAIFHLAFDGRLQAVEAVNATADYMAGRALIGTAKAVRRERPADTAIPAKQPLN